MKTFKKEEYIQKKKELAILSAGIRPLVKMGRYDSINEGLVELYNERLSKENPEHNRLSSFMGWKEKGFRVRKGEKGLPIWSRPNVRNDKKGELLTDDAPTPEQLDENKATFWGLAYLFSNTQVEEILK